MFGKRRKVVQYDLNVTKPESERLPQLYAGDSINMANLRVWVPVEDKEKFLQLVKDADLRLALWSFWPSDKDCIRTVVYPPYPPLKDRLRSLIRRLW